MSDQKIINVFSDGELHLIKLAIEHKLKTTPVTQTGKNTYTNILKIIDRILAREVKSER